VIKLKEIPFGSTDAKNEVLSNTPEEIRRFLASFVTPPRTSYRKVFLT
jgi:hypothetical protein